MDSQTYDMDWGSGTVWNGPLKLGSSAHCKDGAGTKTTASLVSAGLTFEPSLLLLALSGMRPSRAFQREQWPRRGECFTGDLASPQGARSVISTASWNLGGQPVDKLATAVPDVDVFLLQEAARDVEGWQESEDDTHFCTERSINGVEQGLELRRRSLTRLWLESAPAVVSLHW